MINKKEVKCPRVLFAGEATDFTRYGTMDGAMQSGKREAKRIYEYLKSISESDNWSHICNASQVDRYNKIKMK